MANALTDPSHLRRAPQQARSRQKIARVLDAAERLLVSGGAETLTTTRIAAAARISVGSLYQYFPNTEAILAALANRYMAEFEQLMDELVEEALEARWDDPVVILIDAYADRYRAEPGYRALWFGRHLNEELRAADRENKLSLANRVARLLVATGVARDDAYLAIAARAAVLTADALLQEAFRTNPDGDAELLDEAKTILRGHLAAVAAHYRGAVA
jgi:AcrR family transcriptional regulator